MSVIKHKTLAEAIREDNFSYLDSMADYQSLQMIDKQSIVLLLAMNDLNEKLTEAERAKAQIDFNYSRAYRRAYSKYIDGAANETHRKLLAEVDCEELELQKVKNDTYIKEYNRLINKIKIELDVLKSLGHNLRQELKSI